MWNWLITNKEWLFSGAGVAIISFLIVQFTKYWNRTRAPRLPSATSERIKKNDIPESTNSRPYPSEICKAIDDAPPIHQASRSKEFVGLAVNWLVTLEHVYADETKERVTIMFLDRGKYPWVSCKIALDPYPELLVAKSGAKFQITGRISAIAQGEIQLVDAALSLVT